MTDTELPTCPCGECIYDGCYWVHEGKLYSRFNCPNCGAFLECNGDVFEDGAEEGNNE